MALFLALASALARAEVPHGAEPTGRTPDTCSLPSETVLSDANLKEAVDSLLTSSHLHAGSGAMVSDLLGQYARTPEKAERVAQALEAAWDRVGGLKGAPDRGQFLALWGEVAAKLDRESPRLRTARAKLSEAAEIASTVDAVKAAWKDDEGNPLLATARSAAVGLRALGVAGKLTHTERQVLAKLPLVEGGIGLVASFQDVDPDERAALVNQFIATVYDRKSPLSRAPLAALRHVARYLDKRSASNLGSVLEASLERAATHPETFDTDALGALQAIEKYGVDAGAREVARSSLARHGLVGPDAVQNIGRLVTSVKSGIEAVREKDLNKLHDLVKEVGETALQIGLDIAGIIEPSPICDALSCAMSIRKGDYFSAAMSVISMLPYVGDGVVKPLKIGGAAAKVLRLAGQAERLFSKIARAEQQIERYGAILKTGMDAIERGELPDLEAGLELAERLAAGRRHIPQGLRVVRELAAMAKGVADTPPEERVGPLASCMARLTAFQRGLGDFAAWLGRPFARPAPRRFIVRGAMPDDEPEPAAALFRLAEDRMRAMRFTEGQAETVRAALRARPAMTRTELVELLMTTRYPA